MNHSDKNQLGLQTSLMGTKAGTQDKNPEAGTETQTTEKLCFWLADYSMLSLFAYITQDHPLRGGTTMMG